MISRICIPVIGHIIQNNGIRTAHLEGKSSLEEIADLVVEDNRDAAKILKEIGPNKAHLGLNAVGGSSGQSASASLINPPW